MASTVNGTSGNDVIDYSFPAGRRGNESETINGLAGNDTIFGYRGDDIISGNADNDVVHGDEGNDTLFGGSGLDALYGDDGADVINGDEDDDQLYGGVGDDLLYGGVGNDTIDSGTGADLLDGGAGNDTLMASGPGVKRMLGQDGDDIFVASYTALIDADGGAGYDVISGESISIISSKNVEELRITSSVYLSFEQYNAFEKIVVNPKYGDEINLGLKTGGSIDLTIRLGTHKFQVGGSAGDDTILTGDLDDDVSGSGGDDKIFTRGGNDFLSGGGGNDELHGGAGDDEIISSDGSMIAYGEEGNDKIITLDGSDKIYGGAGDDVIDRKGYLYDQDEPAKLPTGYDFIYGEDGNDVLELNAPDGESLFDGGAGIDTVRASSLYYDINEWADISKYDFRNVEILQVYAPVILSGSQLSGLSDLVFSTSNENLNDIILYGRKDADFSFLGEDYSTPFTIVASADGGVINTAGLNVTVDGGRGNDTFISGRGILTVGGFFGDDIYIVDSQDIITEYRGQGNDAVLAKTSYVLAAGQEIERVYAYDAGTTYALDLTGNEFAQTLRGNSGDNVLNGTGGIDTVIGGLGNDTYRVDNAGDVVIEKAGEGSDTVIATTSYTLATGVSVETFFLAGLTGSANLNLIGNEFGQTITGNGGNNTLDGRGGADILQGGAGNDTYRVDSAADRVIERASEGRDTVETTVQYALGAGQEIETLKLAASAASADLNLIGNAGNNRILGGSGTNWLDGGAGDDLLAGKLGNDVLMGRTGRDTFVFDTKLGSDNVDRVLDFEHGTDTLQLDDGFFAGLARGELAASAFKDVGNAGAVIDADDRMIYDHRNGALYFDTNGNGAGGRTLVAILDNRAIIDHTDFLIV